MRIDPETVALFRFTVISEAANARLGARERGHVVRTLAARAHRHPDGSWVRLTRGTIDRWLRQYREGGLDGLRPEKRSDSGAVRRHPELIDLAAALRKELPARSAAHIADIIVARHGVRIAPRTIREQLAKRGLQRAKLTTQPLAYGRYEAARPNEVWVGDVLIGPWVPHPRGAGSKRARLFLLVDDHSRLLVHGRWVFEENARSAQAVLRAAIARRGLPETLYVDNGAPFAAAALERSCAVLGIRLVHSKPYSPQGRGKQERLNRVIRERFLLEAEAAGISDLEELNDRFLAWSESVLNTRVHAETSETPMARFLAGGPPRTPDHTLVIEAFRWSVRRTVTKTATVSLAGNRYLVDPSLVGQTVELRYDPEDLTSLSVYVEDRLVCMATPFVIGRHVHPAVPQASAAPSSLPPAVDYLNLILQTYSDEIVGDIAFRDLADDEEQQ
jgi:putative transposase